MQGPGSSRRPEPGPGGVEGVRERQADADADGGGQQPRPALLQGLRNPEAGSSQGAEGKEGPYRRLLAQLPRVHLGLLVRLGPRSYGATT